LTEVLSAEAQRLLGVLARRWSVPILGALGGGTLRHHELRRAVGDIADKVLVETLRMLEQERLIDRTVQAEVPLRVDYGLTDAARTLYRSLAVLDQWINEHRSTLGPRVSGVPLGTGC
jgi:DNA-binding HxlR family transcriptional regulator